ncbi:MAG: phosphoenolpyruvate carboxykinase (ATP) [Bacteroidota bacterium]|nr:phosphoenolpyruvate carboxykinase (ATP) [Bacteroidota bacterium]
MKHVGNTPFDARLDAVGLEGVGRAHWNLPPAKLILQTLLRGEGVLTDQGALAIETGTFTGRSPKDRFLVKDDATEGRVEWGDINQPMTTEAFETLLRDVQAHLDGKSVFVKDAAVGADERYRIPVRVVAEKAWSSLFVDNMFIRLSEQERWVAEPQWHVVCAPSFKADPLRHGCRQGNVSAIDFGRKIIVVAGSGYTGEIKKGMFSVMNYILPVEHNVLPMHCSSNMGENGDVAVFFGLSGTGKTTLSSDPKRALIGDDEHGWTKDGVFNMEGGCYAKTIDLSPEGEPEIHQAIRFGAMLENIGFQEDGITPDFTDDSITPNTRVSYPIHHIPGAVASGKGGHPTDIFFLTCDAFGVLPPLARLDKGQAMYHFLSGYTAKVAGTEAGVVEPQTTFSACFGAPFLPLHATEYANMLGERMTEHGVRLWLVNTGWTGGGFGVGHRMKLSHTRAMISAALRGELDDVPTNQHPVFNLDVPTACEGVPSSLWDVRSTWADVEAYDAAAEDLASRFAANFAQFAEHATEEMKAGAPRVSSTSHV